MRIWRNSYKDSLLVAISAVQFAVTLILALSWATASPAARVAGGVLVTLMMTYNIIVVSHLFTHMPWFMSARLNALVSVVNSVNIGQSVQAYHLTHVRNHHRFNNDRPGPDGTTRDTTSTYLKGKNGRHRPLLPYAVGGAVGSLHTRVKDTAAVIRLWRVGRNEKNLLSLASNRDQGRARELRQVQADRAVLFVFGVLFAVISWHWTLFCYLPAFFAALILVNVQNYYRHFGANPDVRAADSVSHYSRVYNFLTFNDGFHQEHHLSPSSHWTRMPEVRARQQGKLDAQPRIVSPVPAMLGFLHRGRPQLHLDPDAANSIGLEVNPGRRGTALASFLGAARGDTASRAQEAGSLRFALVPRDIAMFGCISDHCDTVSQYLVLCALPPAGQGLSGDVDSTSGAGYVVTYVARRHWFHHGGPRNSTSVRAGDS